jgi:hypothetical protein
MSQQIINTGAVANDGTGDTLRDAAVKINDNFTELYSTTNLGSFKISGSTLGTQGVDANTWGANWIYLDPAGEGWSGIAIPSLDAQASGSNLQIYNNHQTGGAIQLTTYGGTWNFDHDGKFTGPAMGGVVFGGAIVSNSGNYYQYDINEFSYAFYNNYNEKDENRMIFAAVPADQIVINGAPQGPNNIFGYAVTINDTLVLSGYTNDNKHSIINNHNDSLKLVTNVQTELVSTTFNKNDAYTTARWSDEANNEIVFTGATSGFGDVLYTLHIGDSITLFDGEITHNVNVSKRYWNNRLGVDTVAPTANLDLTSVTFDIKIPTTTAWEFANTGTLTLAGSVVGSNTTSNYIDTIIELDVNATIIKLEPKNSSGAPHYHLGDGVEGQIMYIVPTIGGLNDDYTSMTISHARWSNGNGVINDGTDVGWWLPFRSTSTCLTLIFNDGYWNLPHNVFD